MGIFRGMIAVSVLSAMAHAAVPLFEQTSISIGNPATGSVAAFSSRPKDPNSDEKPTRVWDNFVLESSAEVSGLTWKGAFHTEFNPNPSFRGELDFSVEVFGSLNGNRPGSLLFSTELDGGTAGNNDGTQVTESVVPNAMTAARPSLEQDGGVIVEYSAELTPFHLDAGEYWLSIVGIQTFPSPHPDESPTDPNKHFDPVWSWVFAEQGDDSFWSYDAQFNDPPGGLNFPLDTTFSLIGTPQVASLIGDFDNNNLLEAADIDLLSAEIRSGSTNLSFDLNGDQVVNLNDHTVWVEDIFGTLFGDADLNKVVAFADFLALSNNFGGSAGWAGGDFNADGNVRFADFLFIARNFGLTAAAASTQSVPEPASSTYGLVCLLTWTLRRRRRKP